MKQRSSDNMWIPFWIDKWIFGSMRIEHTLEERAIWVDLLALAAKDNGYIRANETTPYPLQQLSGMLLIPEDKLTDAIENFIKTGKLNCDKHGVLCVTKWEKYQFTDRYRRMFKQDISDKTEDPSENRKVNKRKEKQIIVKNNKRPSTTTIKLILNESPKRWENITDDDKKLWAATYPGVDVEHTLQEMIAYWDAQPASKRKLNWKRIIVNRLKWLQDNGGTRKGGASGEYRASQVGRTPAREKTPDEVAAIDAARTREKAKVDMRCKLIDENKTAIEAAQAKGDKGTIHQIMENIERRVEGGA
jgi:hypothetical protein